MAVLLLGVVGAGAPADATNVVHEYSDHAGCVTLFTRHIAATETGRNWIELKSQMAGCSRGHLHLHTYVNYSEIFETHLLRDGETNDCENSTACEVPWTERIYFVFRGTYTAYAHGWNTTTGGSTYVTRSINYNP
ncbi:MAG TPA: hypothetical protein VF250_07165 [Conexibacter sp.]